MRELALHLLDIAENSISANAKTVKVTIEENYVTDRLRMMVEDDGRGMSAEMVAQVTDPFFTSRTTRKVGMGLPLLKAAAEACNGSLKVTSEVGKGTRVEVEFQHSHIDRMPLGSVVDTMLTLVVGSPEVHWIFRYQVDSEMFEFDDQPFKEELGDIPLSEGAVLGFLREHLQSGVASVAHAPGQDGIFEKSLHTKRITAP